MPLSEMSLRIWRAVAARGRTGIGSAQIHDHFAGQFAADPLSISLQSLRRAGYVRNNGNGKHSTWWATDRVPLGEDRPAWLDDADTESDVELDQHARADAAVASARANVAAWPFGPTTHSAAQADPAPPPAPPAPPHAPAPSPQQPLFALDSEGCLSLRTDGVDGRLSAAATRALFAWLDRLSYQRLIDTVEAEA